MITRFSEENYFLSNFYSCHVSYDGYRYSSAEAAFQAQKSLDPKVREKFQIYTPSTAKAKGRQIKLRPDWEQVKDEIMYKVVKAKFFENKDLAKLLLDTGEQQLQEGNDWGDRYWGVCKGEGLNKLGHILERVRDDLHGEPVSPA